MLISLAMHMRLYLAVILAAALMLVAAAPTRQVPCMTGTWQITNQRADATRLEERRVDFNWTSTKVKGANIGGWLVLEP